MKDDLGGDEHAIRLDRHQYDQTMRFVERDFVLRVDYKGTWEKAAFVAVKRVCTILETLFVGKEEVYLGKLELGNLLENATLSGDEQMKLKDEVLGTV